MKYHYHGITAAAMAWVRRYHLWIAGAIIFIMGVLAMSSMVGNSAIVDELAHIPAGYAYLHYGDYRLNPEHPPLMKDLAAIPLQFMNLKGFKNLPEWTSQVNGEWQAGYDFLYNLGNNAGAILFWARLPIFLVMLIFGGWLYWISRRHWGTAVGLLVLFFYAFSPNFLGHGALVTTDLGAAVFMFAALVMFARFAQNPTRANMWWLSVVTAVAELAKFSSALLYPFFVVVAGALWLMMPKPDDGWARFKTYVGRTLVAIGLSFVWIYLVYAPQVRNMPTSVQDNLINGSLVATNVTSIAHALVNVSHVPLTKPAVQYALGLTMDFGRVAGGNVTYFDGMVNNESFRWYFPELFAVKTQVALLILMLVALGFGWWRLWRGRRGRDLATRWGRHFQSHILEWSLGVFALFYFAVAIGGNLDLGIRHILPVYLPVFVLVALATVELGRRLARTRLALPSGIVVVLLLVWYAASTLWVAPSYLAYFNELIGGPGNVYNYFSDSSIDWGQDFTRLVEYVDNHPQIKHIAVDYFGGAVPEYYECERAYDANGNLITNGTYDCSHSKFEDWHSSYGRYTGQYIAVSETYLENDRYYSAQSGQPGYAYLRAMKPIAKIGYSIYVYKLY